MLSGLPCCQPLPCFAAPTALPLAPAPSLGDSTLLPGALLWGQPLGPRAPDLLQVPRACCKWGDPSHDVPCRTPLHLFLFVMLLSLPGGALAFPRPTSPHPMQDGLGPCWPDRDPAPLPAPCAASCLPGRLRGLGRRSHGTGYGGLSLAPGAGVPWCPTGPHAHVRLGRAGRGAPGPSGVPLSTVSCS